LIASVQVKGKKLFHHEEHEEHEGKLKHRILCFYKKKRLG